MKIKEVFKYIDSIEIHYPEFKKEAFGDVNAGRDGLIIPKEVLNSVEHTFNELIDDVRKLKLNLDESFIEEIEIGSLRMENSSIEPELSISKIANHIYDFKGGFEILVEFCNEKTDLSMHGRAVVRNILKDINSLISVFNFFPDSENSSFSNAKKKLITASMNIISKQLKNKLAEYQKETDKLFNNYQASVTKLESNAEQEFKELNLKVKSIKEAFDSTLKELDSKSTQMDEVLGQTAKRVIAQDYDDSAIDERKAADWLRYCSLACMAVIIGIVCYSFYDSTHSGFDWESSIFRTVLVFILSIPAAYLSRESAKHREQQYNYHHTALDLKAITPYIASLPDEDQNKIKISIAERIFASRQTNLSQQDSFPLNTQELMMELIKKVDVSSKQNTEQERNSKSKEA